MDGSDSHGIDLRINRNVIARNNFDFFSIFRTKFEKWYFGH